MAFWENTPKILRDNIFNNKVADLGQVRELPRKCRFVLSQRPFFAYPIIKTLKQNNKHHLFKGGA